MTAISRWLVMLAPLALSCCVQLSFSHESFDEPIDDALLSALRPGQQDLGDCLSALGAPHRVFPATEPNGEGVALLWVWRDSSSWGFDVSSPSDNVPGSFEFEAGQADLPGCVLWFGGDLVLLRWRAGAIGELLPGRVRPAAPAEH